MQPTENPGYEVDSAVRKSGPTSNGAPSNRIVNGGFDGGTLSPWTSSTDDNGESFSVVDGQAYKSFPLGAMASNDPWGQITMTLDQAVTAAAGSPWFFSAYINLVNNQAGSDTYCGLVFQTEVGTLWSANWYAISDEGTISASGSLQDSATNFEIYVYCSGSYGQCFRSIVN